MEFDRPRSSRTFHRWITSSFAVLLLLLLFVATSHAFDGPGVAYRRGDPLEVKLSAVTSNKTHLPHSYYSLPFCKPEHIVDSVENLGELLRADRIHNSPYVFTMLSPQKCSVLCRITLDAKMAKELKEKIDDGYRVNMALDNLPLVTPVQRPDTWRIKYEPGFDIGYKGQLLRGKEEKYLILNHLIFTFKLDADPQNDTARIVGFEVEPWSLKHEYGEWNDDDQTQLTTTCNHLTKHRCFGSDYQEVEDEKEIVFTYDVVFQTIGTVSKELLDIVAIKRH